MFEEVPITSWCRHDAVPAGDKARGLWSLPQEWVPPFFVLSPAAAEPEGQQAADLLAGFPPAMRGEIETEMLEPAQHLLIRSDRPGESAGPGAGLSIVCDASWPALRQALSDYSRAVDEVGCPIVQMAVEPGVLGAMSNGHEYVPDADQWLVEGILDLEKPTRRRIGSASRADWEECLSATDPDKLLASLETVAAFLEQRQGRFRCEWIWDGERVWIVQADRLKERAGDPTAHRVLIGGRGADLPRSQPSRSGAELENPLRFAKLRSRRAFAELNLPLVPLEAMTVEEWDSLGDRSKWIEQLIARHRVPVVARCDLAEGSTPFLLPTSQPETSPQRLVRFVENAIHSYRSTLPPADVLFLFSPLMPARVSALVAVNEDSGAAEIDALWGFPDGLLNLPHDSFRVGRGEICGSEIRHKPACHLLEDGIARRALLGPPLDWEKTLREDELLTLAGWAASLSEIYGRKVQLMALCRLGGKRGPDGCAPFHCWPVENGASETLGRPPLPTLTIRDWPDLRSEARQCAARLDPDPSLIRSVEFFAAVGEWAVAHEVTVLFSGSFLGHIRAILEKSGAVVFPEDQRIDWSAYRAAVVRTKAGLRRVRMVPDHRQEHGNPRTVGQLPDLGPVEAIDSEQDLPGQPLMMMDDFGSRD